MDILGRALLTYLLHSTLLLAAAALLRLALRERRLALQEAVLRAALLGGFVTAGLQLGLGVEPLAGAVRVPGPAPAIAAHAVSASVDRPPELAATPVVTSAAVPATPRANRVAGRLASALLARWPLVLATSWAVLAALALLRLAIAARRLRAMLRGRRPIRAGELASEAATLGRALGLRHRVRLSAAPRLAVPLATGIVRPEVCLPPRAVSDLGAHEQVALCAHEIAHLARRDPAWILLARIVECVAPLQPLNVLARLRLQDLAECLSDDLAVSVSARPLGLARSLVDVASWTLGGPPLVPAAAAGALSARSRLGHRVERLMDPLRALESPRRSLLPVAACVVLATSLVTPVVSGSAARAEKELVEAVAQADATPHPNPAPQAKPAPDAVPAPRPEVKPESAARADAERRLEELSRRIAARVDAHDAEMRKLEAEIDAVASRTQPNEAVLEKLSHEIAASAAELSAAIAAELETGGTARQGESAKAAARRMAELQQQIRAATKDLRVPDADLRALTDRARALAEEARPSQDELREIRELATRLARDAAPSAAQIARLTREASREARRATDEAREAMRRAADEMRRAADELRARAEAKEGGGETPEPPRR